MASKSAARRKGEAVSNTSILPDSTDQLPNPWAARLSPGIRAFCREVSSLCSLEVLEVIRKQLPEGEAAPEENISSWQELWFMAACRIFALEDGTRVAPGLWLRHVQAVNEYHAQYLLSAAHRANGAV